MRVIPPLLGYTLKTLYQPLSLFARYRELATVTQSHEAYLTSNVPYGDMPEQRLDIYTPDKPGLNKNTALLPAVVYVHGGGFVAGDKCLAASICREVAKNGYTVFNINYRLAPKHPYAVQVQDVSQAVHWVQQRGINHGANTEQIFLMGDTTGANLILTYATALSHPYLRSALCVQRQIPREHLAGLVLMYGAYDLETGLFNKVPFIEYWHAMLLGGQADTDWLSLASPLRHVHYHLPPIFLAAGEADPLFSQSIMLARKLKTMDHPYATAFYDREQHPDGQHLFFTLQFRNCAREMLGESLRFLKLQTHQVTGHPNVTSILTGDNRS